MYRVLCIYSRTVITVAWVSIYNQNFFNKRAHTKDIFKCVCPLVFIYAFVDILSGDYRNQDNFKLAVFSMIRALCQNGQLGPLEMVLLKGYRNKSNDLIVNK